MSPAEQQRAELIEALERAGLGITGDYDRSGEELVADVLAPVLARIVADAEQIAVDGYATSVAPLRQMEQAYARADERVKVMAAVEDLLAAAEDEIARRWGSTCPCGQRTDLPVEER